MDVRRHLQLQVIQVYVPADFVNFQKVVLVHGVTAGSQCRGHGEPVRSVHEFLMARRRPHIQLVDLSTNSCEAPVNLHSRNVTIFLTSLDVYQSCAIGSPNTCIRRFAQPNSETDRTRSRISSMASPFSTSSSMSLFSASDGHFESLVANRNIAL